MIGAQVHQLFEIRAVLHIRQLDDADHGVVRLAICRGRQIDADDIIGRASRRLRVFHLTERPAALRQIVGEHAARFRAHEDAAVFHREFRFGHFALFLSEELHVGNAHTRRAAIIQRAGKAAPAALGEIPQRAYEHGVEVIALQTRGRDGDRLAGIIRDAALMTDIALGVAHGADDCVQVVRLDLRTFVDHHDLGTIAAHGAHGIALDLAAVFQCANTLVAAQLYRAMSVALDLPHDLRIADEIVLNLFDDQCCLFRRTGNNGNQAARIEHAHGDAAERRQPRLAVAAGFDHHLGIGVSELPGDHALCVLQADFEIVLDKYVQMRSPVGDLPRPQFCVSNISNLMENHTTTCSYPTAAMVCRKSSMI